MNIRRLGVSALVVLLSTSCARPATTLTQAPEVYGDCNVELEYVYTQGDATEDGVYIGPAGPIGADDLVRAVSLVRDNLNAYVDEVTSESSTGSELPLHPTVRAPTQASLLDMPDSAVRDAAEAQREADGGPPEEVVLEGTTVEGWPGTSTFESGDSGWQLTEQRFPSSGAGC